METSLCTLCPELKLLVLQYLDIDELLNFSLVSKNWYEFISSDSVWQERFRLLEIKTFSIQSVAKGSAAFPAPTRRLLPKKQNTRNKPESSVESANEFYSISKTLTPKELKEVRNCKFRAVHKVKLSFFLNKTNLICNRFVEAKNIACPPHEYLGYFGNEDEDLMWNNFDENFGYNVRFKIYHVRGTTVYRVVHLLLNKLPIQAFDAGTRYSFFLCNGRFMLAKAGGTFHVYRFSHLTGQFEKTRHLELSEDVHMSEDKLLLREPTATFIGLVYLWHWNLYSGEKLKQIRLSSLVKAGESLLQMFHVKDARVVLLVQYHTKKFVQKKALLLDLATERIEYQTKLNCLQSFMKMAVTCQYFVVLKNKKTEDFQLTFVVYDVDSGSKLYEVPHHPDYLDYKDWFLPRRGDVLIVMSEDRDFYYDLTRQEEIKFTAYNEMDRPSSREASVDVDEYGWLGRNASISFIEGPGDTLFRYRLFNYDHELSISLVDYRNNRSMPVARLEGLKMWKSQLIWDKHYRRLVEYYDHHICGTNFYQVW